ncbi:MAG: DNA cytosine methyltransferase [Thermodesulfobacteriota bacterium]
MLDFIDLYCGGGLGARGAVNAEANPVLAVDGWEVATKTYKENFPDATVITGLVEDQDPVSLAETYSADVLLTSPECTSHSIARGAKEGCEKSRETAINILPWVKAFEPRWVIVENVPRMRKWERHKELRTSLESQGYTVSEVVLNAAELGAPQARKRLFMICDKEGKPPEFSDFENNFVAGTKTARDIIDWSGIWKTNPLIKESRAEKTLKRAEKAIEVLGHGKPFIIVYYGSDYAGGWQSLDVPLRTITTLDRFGLVTYENDEYRLRMLQPPELLKAMGADGHTLSGNNRRNKVKLCGNGVCSTVMEAVFREISRINSEDQLEEAI